MPEFLIRDITEPAYESPGPLCANRVANAGDMLMKHVVLRTHEKQRQRRPWMAFYELGVHKTRGRTGVLVFVAVRERVASLVGDVEVVKQVGQPALDKMAKSIAAAIPAGGDAVCKALQSIDKELAKALPRAADDIDELPNAVHVMQPRRRGRAVG